MRRSMWCIPDVDGTCVTRMANVFGRYADAPFLKRPLVCFDGSPIQVVGY
jgi:hypothetical protein